jgi:hypothetical protein
MSQTMFMFDDTNIALDPPGAFAYAGYVDGAFNNIHALRAMFPKAHILSITALGNRADACDVEAGDMTNADVFGWYDRMLTEKVWKPCVYTSAFNMLSMQMSMRANGIDRSAYRLWSAHYTGVAHFCGPTTCGFGLTQADATQFTDKALGRSLDESIISDGFFHDTAPALNPVTGLNVIVRGFTGADLAWDHNGATSYTVKSYRARSGRLKETQVVTTNSARVHRLRPWPPTSYIVRVRAEPGDSVGADAEIRFTTR